MIFTSKTGIDHFFRICNDLRITVPDTMKYFCITDAAFYLQKYIIYRKRKIFHGKAKFQDLIDIIIKHKDDHYFVPLSEPVAAVVRQVIVVDYAVDELAGHGGDVVAGPLDQAGPRPCLDVAPVVE